MAIVVPSGATTSSPEYPVLNRTALCQVPMHALCTQYSAEEEHRDVLRLEPLITPPSRQSESKFDSHLFTKRDKHPDCPCLHGWGACFHIIFLPPLENRCSAASHGCANVHILKPWTWSTASAGSPSHVHGAAVSILSTSGTDHVPSTGLDTGSCISCRWRRPRTHDPRPTTPI
ncbi:hypothetical protein K504DRAFT_107481 [Pleomassaria siparia CBS 279.74]|uniref:Uncharacterized protein n=1 Tax=Pleomassaria siparia CBS 279.74 TaxID=1314801 RepID=A0A6G1JY30_9PLEO|nr:hypothetical protein K504DRAFT_107481 [Pleomassaria siparia CBS 279.74]